jgi:hypothetical protein
VDEAVPLFVVEFEIEAVDTSLDGDGEGEGDSLSVSLSLSLFLSMRAVVVLDPKSHMLLH